MNNKIALFEESKIRKVYKNNEWYYSINDVITLLTDTKNPYEYLKKIKQKDKELERIWHQICIHLNMVSTDGKIRKVMTSNTKGILRIIESISSEKTENIKIWLAALGTERLEEINNPELLMDRMKKLYELKGYSKGWIEQREREITTRHSLKEEWETRGIKERKDYLILTDEIYKSNFNINIKEYQNIKNIDDSSYLRDSMTNLELALTNLIETTTLELHKKNNSQGIKELSKDIDEVGNLFEHTKKDIENKLDKKIVSPENYMNLTR